MKTSKFKRAIVMLLAITMLLTSTGMASFAESMGEGADKVSTEAVVTESGSDAVQAAAEEAAAEINDEEVPEAAPSESTEPADDPAPKADEAKAALTAKDWEAGLPDDISKDVREAMAQVAKSQLKAEGDLYKAFANAESLDNWDASFVMFVLEYANVLGVSKAIGDESKGTVDKDDISVPVNADTDKWIKALKDKGLFTEIGEEAAPQQGDIVFTEDGAAVVIDAEDLTVIGAHNNNVEKFKADADKVSGFVSLKDIAPAEFADEEQAEEPAEETAEAADDADEEVAELTEEELAAKKAEEEAAAKAAEEAAKAQEAGLFNQTVEAELTSAPGFGGKLRSLFTSSNDTEITISGYLPEDATVKAYPVKVEIPGQNVLVAYDITIYVKDEEGKEVEWQPETALSVSIKNKELKDASGELSVFHMDNKNSTPEFVTDSTAVDGAVSFDAGSFSIYIVTKNTTKTFNFMVDGKVYYKQTLENGQSLAEPPAPTKKGSAFKHWSATESGSTPYDFSQPVSVSDSDHSDVTIYAVFEEQKWLITYHDQLGGIVESQLKSSNETVNTSEVNYTPVQNEEGSHLKFMYWTDDPDGDKANKGTFTPDKDTDLYPVVEAGHWIYFDVNKAAAGGADADYAAPMFVLPGDSNKPGNEGHPVSVTAAEGYRFLGWYTRKHGGEQVFDENGIRVENGYAKITKDGELYSEPTLYAHWELGQASYAVNYYIQLASDEVNGAKHYEFYKSGGTRRANVNSTVSLDEEIDTVEHVFGAAEGATQEEINLSLQNIHGFKLSTDQNQSVVVKADGTTELQVKFDRKSFTLKFYNFAIKNARVGTTSGIIQDNTVTNFNSGAYPNTPPNSSSLYVDYETINGRKYYYFWNRPINPTVITALYGHDISDQFGFSVSYKTSRADNESSWNSNWSSSNKVAWFDANQTSHDSCGIRDMFRVLYKMPSLYDINENDLTEDVLIHNQRVTTTKELYYYKEEIYNSGHNYSTNIGQQYVKKTFDGKECYFRLASTMHHSYGQVVAFNKDALFQPMEGYDNITDHCEPANLFEMGSDGKPVNIPPTTSAAFYTFKSYNLTLVDPTGKTADTTIPIKYTASLTDSELSEYYNTIISKNGVVPTEQAEKTGTHWYRDEALTNAVDFDTFSMPPRDVTFYAGVTEQYIVRIDPAGGELFGAGNGALGNDYSTWFRLNKNGIVSEYKNVERNYVKTSAAEATHKYTKNDYPNEPRTAKYEAVASGAEYRYEKGAYVLTGWVKVTNEGTPNEQEEEYNFSTPVTSDLLLRAKWRRNANFRVVYDATGDIKAPTDNNKYEDGSHAVAAAPLDSPEGQRFVCWKNTKTNTTYKPEQLVEINEGSANLESDGSMTVNLVAVYESYDPDSNIMADYVFMNGDDVYYTQTISQGEELVLPQPPAQEGAVFTGWYRDPACTQRFDGFGKINNPVYTTLYAGFKTAFTVEYLAEEDGSIIATQLYNSGEKLHTTGVEWPVGTGKVMLGWTDGSEAADANPYKYNARTNISVTGNMTLWPVVQTLETLSFDTKGGSTVSPIVIPTDRRPVMPPEPSKYGFLFAGWFTDEACTDGHEYDFSTPLGDGITRLYAKWDPDTTNPAVGELTVLLWAQTPDRPEDNDEAAADKTHYELANSFTLEKGFGTYSLSDIQTELPTVGNGIADVINLTNVRNRYSDSTDNQFRKYFSYNADKSDSSVTVGKREDNVLNLYYDRQIYHINFKTNNHGSIMVGETEYTGSDYTIDVWLDKDISDQWPSVRTDKAHVVMSGNNKFGSWAPPSDAGDDVVGGATLQLLADREKIDYAAGKNNKTIVFTLETTSNTKVATVHYYLNGVEEETLKLTPYYASTTSSNYGSTNGVNYYTGLLPKEIEGYDNISSASEALADGKYNPVVSGNPRAVRVGSYNTSSLDLYFYYKKHEYNIKLMESATAEFKNVKDVPYETKITGSDGILETDASIGKPQPPSEGLEFDCWSTSMASSNEYTTNGGRMPAYDITLYARWRPIQVTITTVDGDETQVYPTKDYGTTLEAFEIPDPSKEGYIFIGWEDAATGRQISPKAAIVASMTLKPIWRNIQGKTVTYNLNGGHVSDGASAPSDSNKYATGASALVLSGSDLSKTLKDIDNANYEAGFVHWNTQSDDKGIIYYPGSTILIGDSNITLYAIYSSKRQTDVFYNKNGSNAEFVATQDGEVVDGVTLAQYDADNGTIRVLFKDDMDLNPRDHVPGHPNSALIVGHDNNDHEFIVRRPGYVFNNWSITAAAEEGNIENGQTMFVNTLGNSNALYAIWSKDTLPVEVYEYDDDEALSDASLVEGSAGTYHQTSVDTSSQDIPTIETAYKSQDGISYDVGEGYSYEKAYVGNDEIDSLQYVLNEDGTGYEWQYHEKDADADAFSAVGTATLKIYYHKNTKGTLTISKTVRNTIEGMPVDANQAFEFTLTDVEGADATDEFVIERSSTDTTTPASKIKKGETFKLKHDEVAKIILPKGKEIIITETPVNGYTASFECKDEAEPITAETNGYKTKLIGDNGTLAVTNTLATGNLTVTKTATGGFADKNKEFTFTLDAVDGAAAGTTFTIQKGTAEPTTIAVRGTFTLKDGESATLTLPRGKEIKITEEMVDGYTATFTPGDGTSDEGAVIEGEGAAAVTTGQKLKLTAENGELKVENEFNDGSVVPSGIAKSNTILIPLFLGLILVLGIVLSIIQRRRMASRTR